jgi:hypothetical protein
MLNTINATNPMLTNSTTTATKSYSSQCRLPEGMMFIPVSWTFFLDAKIGGHLTSIFDADQKMSHCEICSAGLVLHIEKSKKAIDVTANLSDQQAPTGRIATPPSSMLKPTSRSAASARCRSNFKTRMDHSSLLACCEPNAPSSPWLAEHRNEGRRRADLNLGQPRRPAPPALLRRN